MQFAFRVSLFIHQQADGLQNRDLLNLYFLSRKKCGALPVTAPTAAPSLVLDDS